MQIINCHDDKELQCYVSMTAIEIVLVFGRVSEYPICKCSTFFWKTALGTADYLHLKKHAQKQLVFLSTQKCLWGILC